MPFDRLATFTGDPKAVPVRVVPPSPDVHVAVYVAMAAPPLSAGGLKETLVVVVAGVVAAPMAGGSGAVAGTLTLLDAEEAEESPAELVATTVHV